MENRREYFDRSKLLLGKARSLVFLSSSQEQLWRQWASEEAVTLPSMIETVGLSVNDDLAATAGLDSERESDVSTGKHPFEAVFLDSCSRNWWFMAVVRVVTYER